MKLVHAISSKVIKMKFFIGRHPLLNFTKVNFLVILLWLQKKPKVMKNYDNGFEISLNLELPIVAGQF